MEELSQLGRYRILQLIATGGMGEVFLARSEGPRGFAKKVVVKRILPHLAREPQFVEMFLNEARLAALLSHPNIVQIFELGEAGGSYFIAMEYIHGRSLRAIKRKLIERRQLFSAVLAARLCAQALQGLHYAHQLTDEVGTPLNVVHRDISPDNLLVTFNGMVKVVDFGIAKAANAVSTTRTGTIKGKYAYMAPEQLTGGTVDARTDVYAMGVLLYELLTGARPYSAPTEPALIHTILSTEPKAPKERNPHLPDEISDLILRALQKDPAKRFSTADEMAVALEDFVTSSGQTLTAGQIGAFLKDLFAGELAQTEAGLMTPGPAPAPQPSGPLQVASGAAAPASESPDESADEMATVAATELSPPTPISAGARELLTRMATQGIPSSVEVDISGVKVEPGSRVPPVVASPKPPARTIAIAAGVGLLVVGAAAAAYVAGRNASGRVEAVAAAPAVVTPQSSSELAAPPAAEPTTPEVVATAIAEEPTSAGAGASAIRSEAAPEKSIAEAATDGASAAASQDGPDPGEGAVSASARSPADPKSPESEWQRSHERASRTRAPGKVSFRVNPWAEVFHDGRSLGITPMAPVTVPAGRQTFTLKNADLGKTRKVTVHVPSGGEAILKADLFE